MLNMITLHTYVKILPILMSLVLVGVLCSPFVPFALNDCFFRLYPLSIGISAFCIISFLCSLWLHKGVFVFTYFDGLIVAIIAYYLLRYDYSLRLADWKIFYAILLMLLWFSIRIMLSYCPDIRKILPIFISLVGCMLSVWGVMQLYGLVDSAHPLFRITGPFFNPGPYSGYLALLLPVSLHGFLSTQGRIRYLHILSMALMFCILPAAMSRSAWMAIAVSMLWVLVMQKGWLKQFWKYCKKTPYRAIGCIMIGCFIVFFVAVGVFQIKANSAYGRLLIWKNTCQAISEHPFIGYGVGRFPAVYGKAQADYFASGQATDLEKYVAGYVEYAFNDYLQLTIEGGILLLILVLICGVLVFRQGLIRQEYGLCGALLAFSFFAVSSYPLQVLPFGIVIVVFSAFCVTVNGGSSLKGIWRLTLFLSLLLCIGGGMIAYKLSNLPKTYKEWRVADMMFHQSFYDAAVKSYQNVYACMNGNITFLHNYAAALHGMGKTMEACRILEREKEFSNDSAIWNVLGLYYQSLGNYCEAERCFKYSLCLAPFRIYPYYLLTKLYCEKEFFDKSQAMEMAGKALRQKPKVHSKVVDQMKEEILSLYNQLKSNY